MNCCWRQLGLYGYNARWLSGLLIGRVQQTGLHHSGRLSTNYLLNVHATRFPSNNTCFDGTSRHFVTSHPLQAPKSTKTKEELEDERRRGVKKAHEWVLIKLAANAKYKDLNANFADPEKFEILLNKLHLLGLGRNQAKWSLSAFFSSEEKLDHYIKTLTELEAEGFSTKFNLSLFKPLRDRYTLPDIDKHVAAIEKLRNTYGMSNEVIQDLSKDNIPVLLQKVGILISAGFPQHMDFGVYGFLFMLPKCGLQELCEDLQVSGLTEYRVTDIQKRLSENNYGIEHIGLLSKFTGISVTEIRQLTKHFNHRYIPIMPKRLKENFELMKSYGLSSVEICKVCCFLNMQNNDLGRILKTYSELNDSGIAPWSLYVYLSNPCVQQFTDSKMGYFKRNITEFQSKFEINVTLCQQTLISLLVLRKVAFKTTMEKIEILNSVLPIEEIITPKGISFISRLTSDHLIQGVKRSENLPEPSIDLFLKSFFYKKKGKIGVEQRKSVCRMLNLSYEEARRGNKIFPVKPTGIEENLTILRNYGFSLQDIRKLFVIAFANTEQLKHQLNVLASRPEVQASNVQVTSFKALNYVQYFLEKENKSDEDLDRVGILHIGNDDDDEKEVENEGEDEKDFENDKDFGF